MTTKKRPIPHGTANGYNNYGCRCDSCRDAWRNYYRESATNRSRHRPRAEYLAEMAALPIPHGTETGYNRRCCRCEQCREAANAARHKRRLANPGNQHGSYSTYANGCRCRPCCVAHTTYRRELRASRRVTEPLFPEQYDCECGGLGYIPEDGSGWARVCDCSDLPPGRVYRPELCEDFLLTGGET